MKPLKHSPRAAAGVANGPRATWASIAVLVFALGTGVLVGCGSTPVHGPPPAGRARAVSGPPVVEVVDELPPDNPRWALLAESFERYARRPVTTQKDVFKSRLDKYVEHIEIKRPEESTAQGEEPEVTVDAAGQPLEPLKRFPADRFVPVMIMTGVGRPKALVRDPQGNTHTIQVNSEVGNEQGVVVSITQHEIVIRHADPQPVRLSLRPEVFDLAEREPE